jgi:UDP-N-acetylglucosamine 2-epimerase
MNVLTVVGARPQFVKAGPVSRALREAGHHEILVHTGQHYDPGMSQVFFDELGLAAPDVNLGVGSGSHGQQTAAMLTALEAIIRDRAPHWVLVYGDTNSTLAAALAACKLGVPLAHVEAGLRSFNRAMPEEHNRVLTDHCSELLFCPTRTAMDHLAREGLGARARLVGDVMFDAMLAYRERAGSSRVLGDLELAPGAYALATIHRPASTDDPGVLAGMLSALGELGVPVVLPLHPRTRARLDPSAIPAAVRMIPPVGFLDMIQLEANARVILTDSGGVQKEAYFLEVPCVTMRSETEWVETVEAGWNQVVGTAREAIVAAGRNARRPEGARQDLYGDGRAAAKIASALAEAR